MSSNPILLDLPDAIETARLLVRAPRPGDGATVNSAVLETWDALHRWMPWATERPTLEVSEDVVRRGAASFRLRTDLPMLMFRRGGGEFVGGTGLHRMDWSVPRFEIGYWVRASCEGQGYVSEAVRGLARFALAALGAQRVEIHCSHRNERSQRVAERCGFQLDGRLRNHGRDPSGELRDMMIYALVPGDAAAQALVAPP